MTAPSRRRSGLMIPLFSSPSTTSWGIGDIGDIAPMTAWLAGAGQSILQLLPMNEMSRGQRSPYSAISALAIDPIYIRLQDVPEFAALGGEASLDAHAREALAAVRESPRVDYTAVRLLKRTALRAAFDRFYEREWQQSTGRAADLRAFLDAERQWLDDYALFRALHTREEGCSWTEWPAPLRDREPAALARTRQELAREILYCVYTQWIADTQWKEARRAAHGNGVALFGDLPFMVDGNSADVWLHQQSFRFDVSIGVPPDAFSATGQDWGMPLYRWDEIAANDFAWIRQRARRSAALFDGYRVDHLVGFYRTYARPNGGGEPFFTPAVEEEQVALGERVLGIMREPGTEIIAEDLGLIPDFVKQSLVRLGLPGFRVFRWERRWDEPGQPFRDPQEYPVISVATTGTHDTEPVAAWWDALSDEDRWQVEHGFAGRMFDQAVRDRLVEILFAASSELLIFPIQDVFGWRDRINTPGTVTDLNWTYRLPWPVDRLAEAPVARECQARLRGWCEKYGRGGQGEGGP